MPEIRAWRNAGKGSLWFAPFVALPRVKPLGLGAKDRIDLEDLVDLLGLLSESSDARVPF